MRRISLFSFTLLSSLALVTACADDATTDPDAGSTTAASGTGTDSVDGESESADWETDEGSTDATTTETDDASFISEEGPDTGMDTGGLGMLGDMCGDDSECEEDLFCNGIQGFGGVCSECDDDGDCPDNGNCTFNGAWFACGDGSAGQMCESDESCADGLYCAEVVDFGGFFNGNFCSECAEDMHCPDGQLCAPTFDFQMFTGGRECINPGTAPNDSLCDADGSGDEQCEGKCGEVDIMGFLTIGVCGDCDTDMDCAMGETCMPGMADQNGFSGPTCG